MPSASRTSPRSVLTGRGVRIQCDALSRGDAAQYLYGVIARAPKTHLPENGTPIAVEDIDTRHLGAPDDGAGGHMKPRRGRALQWQQYARKRSRCHVAGFRRKVEPDLGRVRGR